MVLTVSTLQDLVLWILLNLSISLIQTGKFEIWSFVITTLITIGLLFLARLIAMIVRKYNLTIKKNVLSVCFLVLFAIIYLLSKLNVNIMYSAFIGGYLMRALLPNDNHEVEKIKDFAMALFVPIYFALVGIQLDVVHNFSLPRFLLFFVIATKIRNLILIILIEGFKLPLFCSKTSFLCFKT